MTFPNFNDHTDEGKMLLAAMAILTSIECKDIIEKKFGGMVGPNEAFEKVVDIANKIYFEEEYNQYLEQLKRDNKINTILE